MEGMSTLSCLDHTMNHAAPIFTPLSYCGRPESVSSFSTLSSTPALSEAEVLRSVVKATSLASLCLGAFEHGDKKGTPGASLRGFQSFTTGFQLSEAGWERLEMHRFLECICAAPRSKRSRGRVAAPPTVPGDWVLDCYVAERFYSRSGFGRAVYRALRTRAEESGYVLTERRKDAGKKGGKPQIASEAPKPSDKPGAALVSATSIPLLLKISPAGWEVLRQPVVKPETPEPSADALCQMLRGVPVRLDSRDFDGMDSFAGFYCPASPAGTEEVSGRVSDVSSSWDALPVLPLGTCDSSSTTTLECFPLGKGEPFDLGAPEVEKPSGEESWSKTKWSGAKFHDQASEPSLLSATSLLSNSSAFDLLDGSDVDVDACFADLLKQSACGLDFQPALSHHAMGIRLEK